MLSTMPTAWIAQDAISSAVLYRVAASAVISGTEASGSRCHRQ
jgi:hypothetical protein